MSLIPMIAFSLNPMVASIVAFIGVTGALGALFMLFDGASGSAIEDRLDVLAGKKNGDGPQVSREALMKEGLDGLTGFAGKIVERFANLKLLFVQADTTMKPEQFAMIMAVCAGVVLTIGIVLRAPFPTYPLLAIVGSMLPFGWLMFKRARRFKKFGAQLCDAMELIARALRSGHSLNAALKVVVDELPDPISKEFNIAYEEQNLGVPIEQALKNVNLRIPNMDYKFFSMAVAIQRQSGGDLSEILDKIGHIIRDRVRIMGQIQALTGEGRISGIVLMALPVALFFVVWRMNPDYVMLLFTDELGRKMVAVAVVLQILGAYTIKKIIDIKV